MARLFPFLRPRSAQCLAFAERVARELGPADSDVPAERVEEGLQLLGAAAQIALVEAFVTRHPEQWTSVCRDLDDDALARRVLAAGAVRAAIDDRRLPPRRLLDDLEAGVAPTRPPQAALSLALRPNGIWSIEEAQEADRAASAGGLLGIRWSAEIKRVGAKRLTAEHTERVRTLAALLASQLPVHGVPGASACLAGACERVRRERSFAREVAVASLAVYVAHFHAIPRSVN